MHLGSYCDNSFIILQKDVPLCGDNSKGIINSTMLYTVELHIVCADNLRYKYTNSKWHSAGTSDVTHDVTRMKYQHPSTPALGNQLNDQPMDFKTMKLTHYSNSKNGHVSSHCVPK